MRSTIRATGSFYCCPQQILVRLSHDVGQDHFLICRLAYSRTASLRLQNLRRPYSTSAVPFPRTGLFSTLRTFSPSMWHTGRCFCLSYSVRALCRLHDCLDVHRVVVGIRVNLIAWYVYMSLFFNRPPFGSLINEKKGLVSNRQQEGPTHLCLGHRRPAIVHCSVLGQVRPLAQRCGQHERESECW
jgi:hypothetical protein